MNRGAKYFVRGFIVGVIIIAGGTPFIFELPAIGAYLYAISHVLSFPGVLMSLPLHNLVQHPLWAVGCLATMNGILYGLLFILVAKKTRGPT